MIVVSDTSPLNYLVLIEAQDVLPRLFPTVMTTPAVLGELSAAGAADAVRAWAAAPPSWLRIQSPQRVNASLHLGAGEVAALSLALELRQAGGDIRVLIDERDGRAAARRLGLSAFGTLAVLSEAARAGLIALPAAIERLRQTSFHAKPELFEELLRLDRERRGVT